MQLRQYQQEAVDSIFNYFANGGTGNPLVAMPTGTGKSLIIGGFIKRVMTYWPRQRFLVLTHVKELIEQNALKLQEMWPDAPIGINSAGLRQRDTLMPILFGGIGSVKGDVASLGWRDLLFIDEAHLLSPNSNTMYQQVITLLRAINPHLKIIGLTATPWRTGQGMLTNDGLFTDICFDITGVEAFNRLIAEGYLAPLIPKRTHTALDTSDVSVSNGEFVQSSLQKAVDKEAVTFEGLRELVHYGEQRQSWLVFASGVEHADHIAEMLRLRFGVAAAAVHSKSTDRDAILADFKTGRLRCVVNNNVLTTGFDYPPIDLIGMFRPTMSTGLWVQMLGRGTRPSRETHKQNCLVLDFARNTERLGPINDPVIPKQKKGEPGEAPVKICEACGAYNHASARICCDCGTEFVFKNKLVQTASTEELLRGVLPVVEYFDVDRVIYNRHEKPGSPPSIRASYYSGMRMFNDWVCLEHTGYARAKARDWWRMAHWGEPPETTDDALRLISQLRSPRRIRVHVNKKYPEILGYEY